MKDLPTKTIIDCLFYILLVCSIISAGVILLDYNVWQRGFDCTVRLTTIQDWVNSCEISNNGTMGELCLANWNTTALIPDTTGFKP